MLNNKRLQSKTLGDNLAMYHYSHSNLTKITFLKIIPIYLIYQTHLSYLTLPLFHYLALVCLLQTRKQISKKFIPGLRAANLKNITPGMSRNPATHKQDTSNYRLQPSTTCLLQSQSLRHNHVLGNHPEHVVNQHPQQQKCTVHFELP